MSSSKMGVLLERWAWHKKVRGPHGRKARGICRICYVVNPALALLMKWIEIYKEIKTTVKDSDIFYSHLHEAFYIQNDAYHVSRV